VPDLAARPFFTRASVKVANHLPPDVVQLEDVVIGARYFRIFGEREEAIEVVPIHTEKDVTLWLDL